jgi:predicted metal-dependent hydrolase
MNNYPQAYIDYLVFFHSDRDYFECHEVMEEFWKAHPKDPMARTYVGLIQIAVGLYHHRRANLAGAVKMLQSSLNQLKPEHVEKLGIDSDALLNMIRRHVANLHHGQTEFQDLNIPIADSLLLELCVQESLKRGKGWGPNSEVDEQLVHKHTLRDRSEVIETRKQQLELRRKLRGEAAL